MSIRNRHLAVRRAQPSPLRGAQVLARRLSYRSRRSAAASSAPQTRRRTMAAQGRRCPTPRREGRAKHLADLG